MIAAVTERDILQAQNDRLRHLLLKLTRMQFGARSERLPEEQLQLGLEALEQAIAKDEAEAEKQDPELRKDNAAKRRANRGALPAHLPRIEVILEPEDTACPCCRAPMTVIGEDTSERLDVIPVQFRVIVTKRPKLACRACPGTVVQAPAPARLIEGGIPTEALVAHVAVSRYADHQPLYRLAQIMARQGVIIDTPKGTLRVVVSVKHKDSSKPVASAKGTTSGQGIIQGRRSSAYDGRPRQSIERRQNEKLPGTGVPRSQLSLVAGTGFEPVTFRL